MNAPLRLLLHHSMPSSRARARHIVAVSQSSLMRAGEQKNQLLCFRQRMNATTMEDEWFARNMPGNIRTAEPAANDAVPQFPLDALYPQQHNNTNNRTFDIQQLMRLNQNSPTSPALNSSSDSPTHMLLRLLGLIPGNPAGGDLPAGLPGVLDTAQTFKRQGLSVDNIDLSNGQLQNIQELLRNQQPNSLQLPQQSAALQVSAAEASYLQHAGHHLEMPDCEPPILLLSPVYLCMPYIDTVCATCCVSYNAVLQGAMSSSSCCAICT